MGVKTGTHTKNSYIAGGGGGGGGWWVEGGGGRCCGGWEVEGGGWCGMCGVRCVVLAAVSEEEEERGQ